MNIDWTIRFPAIEAYCHGCRTRYLIEFVTPTKHIVHCNGNRTPLPEKIYERWIAIKENKLTGRKMGATGEPLTATNPCDTLPTAGDGKLREPNRRDMDYNVKYF
jgi:hypothetical protein